MKKILSIIVFLLVPLALAIPGFMGWQTQKTMNETVAYIDQLPTYNARWRNYQRGWFTSHGVLEVEVAEFDQWLDSEEPVILPVNFELKHGPLLMASKVAVGWFALDVRLLEEHEDIIKQFLTLKEEGPAYHLQALMALDGTTQISDRWLPFAFDHDDFSIEVAEAYEGQGQVGMDRQLTYSMVLPSVRVVSKENGAEALLENIAGDMALDLAQLHPANVAPGQVSLTVAQFKVPSESVAITDMSMVVNTTLDDAQTMMSSESEFKMSSVVTPELSVTDAAFKVSYSNISLRFLELYQDYMATADLAAPGAMQQELGSMVLNELLPGSPKLAFEDIRFTSPAGSFESNFALSVEGDALKQAQVDPMNPLGVLPFLVATVDSRVSAALVDELARLYMQDQIETQLERDGQQMTEADIQQMVDAQAPSVIEMLQMQGLIILEGDDYTMNLDYQKGEASLNGNPMPLPF